MEIRKVQTSAINIEINDVEATRLKGGHNNDLDWYSPFYRSKYKAKLTMWIYHEPKREQVSLWQHAISD